MTTDGRIVGVFVLAIGVALFWTVTGYVANIFLSPRKHQAREAASAERRLAEIEELLGGVDEANAALPEKVGELRVER